MNHPDHPLTGDLGLEAMVEYSIYYRQYGVRRPMQLVAPPMPLTTKLDLPKRAILHFVGDESQYGIDEADFLLRSQVRPPLIDSITQLGDTLGAPLRTPLQVTTLLRQYRKLNRRTLPVRSLQLALNDHRSLLVENYAMLPHLYRYRFHPLRSWYRWWNIQAAMFKRVGELASQSDRPQILQVKLPEIPPSIMYLNQASQGISRRVLERIPTTEGWFLVELWKWLGEQREQSVLSLAGEGIKNLNLLFVEGGRWSFLNLGLLNSWRKSPENTSPDAVLPPIQLQRRFLRLVLFLHQQRLAVAEADTALHPTRIEPETTQGGTPTVQKPEVNAQPPKITVFTGNDSATKAQTIRLVPNVNVDTLTDSLDEETEAQISKIDQAIDADLKALDLLAPPRLQVEEDKKPETVVAAYTPPVATPLPETSGTPTEALNRHIEKITSTGLVTGANLKRLQVISKAWETLPDPYGNKGSLSERIRIDPAVLKTDEPLPITDSKAIVDKSMLQSSLQSFDRKYIEQVLPSDITSMVVNLSRAGVAVTNYQISSHEDAMGAYDEHRVQLTPLVGKSSTVTWRLPRIEPDGTFRTDGTKLRIRKQRGDLPIRKVAPDRVTLTSYYSKLSVSRAERATLNYPQWLTNQIAARSMDPEDTTIQNAALINVFDASLDLPRLYSTLAMRFSSFSGGGIQWHLDYPRRQVLLGNNPEAIRMAEKNGRVAIGVNEKGIVAVDRSDVLWQGDQSLGRIEQVLGLPDSTPIEQVLLRVFGKGIPLGVVLAYRLGLSNLLAQLLPDGPIRRISADERLSLSPNEYALRFSDYSLILPKYHPSAPILSGFNAYERTLSQFSMDLFDKRDVYLNLLTQHRLSVRYLRELDLLDELFVDPITEELLRDMKEPQTFIGLLLRAAELLRTDQSPDETDLSQMRVKGYERMAGVVYGELARAIRLQRARGGNAKIELPPFQIWQAVADDQAIRMVEDSNPIHNLKEREELTYTGIGGRTSRSMVRSTRIFHESDLGVISEATKDSSDVAVTTFLTADPKLISLRGVTGRYDPKVDGPSRTLSTSALLAPMADRDDCVTC